MAVRSAGRVKDECDIEFSEETELREDSVVVFV